MEVLPQAVTSLAARLTELSWVRDLLVAGSLATGDYVPGVSDLDLVAVVAGSVHGARTAHLVEIHQDLDRGSAAGADLGVCTSRRAGCSRRRPGTPPGRMASSSTAACPE